jgi:hypothetical protein
LDEILMIFGILDEAAGEIYGPGRVLLGVARGMIWMKTKKDPGTIDGYSDACDALGVPYKLADDGSCYWGDKALEMEAK